MGLGIYQRKRNFKETPEPQGKIKDKKKGRGPLRFVIHLHQASRLHFDFRLEFDGVLKSWAVPKGPSFNPLDKRLAVFVEDHPLEYGHFEGIIPKGNYGAGTVIIWDEGTYVERNSQTRKESEEAMLKGLEKGHLTFVLEGKKLKGEFALIKLKKSDGEKAWLLIKKQDAHANFSRHQTLDQISVKSGRTLEEVTREAPETGEIWSPRKKKQNLKKLPVREKLRSQPRPHEVIPHQVNPQEVKKISLDPMPRKNKPMVATLSIRPPSFEGDHNQWTLEKIAGGLRALAEVEGRRVHLYSKSHLPFEKKFPKIVQELQERNLNAVLDGEIVTHDKNKGKVKDKKEGEAIYEVFDILYSDGRDLRKVSLKERKQILTAVIEGNKKEEEKGKGRKGKESERKYVRLVKALEPNPKANAKAKGSFDLRKGEKVVAKNLESLYHSGTTSEWLILKELSSNSSLPMTSTSTSGEDPRLTNLSKIYWPVEKITKGDLLNYYKQIAPFILPYLIDRPESLNRMPNGIAAPGFYQKDMTGHIPRWLKTHRLFSESADRSIDYVLCQDERSLIYIVNLGCIEINPWFSRIEKLDNPDFMVIDLDPDGNDFDHLMEVAHKFHEILNEIGAKNFCKTSGATGIHIGVPVGAHYDYDQVRAFAEAICRKVAQIYPATTSIDRNPNRRRGKIYLDFMQNKRGQTLAAPYCVRPMPGAPVSMPLPWKELRPGLRPQHFNLQNAFDWIKKFGDCWKGVLGRPINLEKCLKNLS